MSVDANSDRITHTVPQPDGGTVEISISVESMTHFCRLPVPAGSFDWLDYAATLADQTVFSPHQSRIYTLAECGYSREHTSRILDTDVMDLKREETTLQNTSATLPHLSAFSPQTYQSDLCDPTAVRKNDNLVEEYLGEITNDGRIASTSGHVNAIATDDVYRVHTTERGLVYASKDSHLDRYDPSLITTPSPPYGHKPATFYRVYSTRETHQSESDATHSGYATYLKQYGDIDALVTDYLENAAYWQQALQRRHVFRDDFGFPVPPATDIVPEDKQCLCAELTAEAQFLTPDDIANLTDYERDIASEVYKYANTPHNIK